MLIIRGGINSKKRELCPTALALSAFYYNKNKHADTYIMYLHAYSTSATRKVAHCLRRVGHSRRSFQTWQRHRIRCQTRHERNTRIFLQRRTPSITDGVLSSRVFSRVFHSARSVNPRAALLNNMIYFQFKP